LLFAPELPSLWSSGSVPFPPLRVGVAATAGEWAGEATKLAAELAAGASDTDALAPAGDETAALGWEDAAELGIPDAATDAATLAAGLGMTEAAAAGHALM
jgi:hypothetical protein